MYHSSAIARDILLVDLETGVPLQLPAEVAVSIRYIVCHPFIERTATHVIVGPDAAKVAGGAGGTDYALYEILREEIGQLYLKRES